MNIKKKYWATTIRRVANACLVTIFRSFEPGGVDLQKLAQEFPEINRYTRVGPTVSMIPPISLELGQATVSALGLNHTTGTTTYDIVGLDRHGIVAVGQDAWSVFEHVERLEHICQIALAAK